MQSISFKYFVQSCATNFFMHFQIYSYDNNQALIFTATKTGGMGCCLCQNCATCLIYLAPTPCLASYILMVSKGLHFSAFSFCKHIYTRQHKTSSVYFRAFRGKFPHQIPQHHHQTKSLEKALKTSTANGSQAKSDPTITHLELIYPLQFKAEIGQSEHSIYLTFWLYQMQPLLYMLYT